MTYLDDVKSLLKVGSSGGALFTDNNNLQIYQVKGNISLNAIETISGNKFNGVETIPKSRALQIVVGNNVQYVNSDVNTNFRAQTNIIDNIEKTL